MHAGSAGNPGNKKNRSFPAGFQLYVPWKPLLGFRRIGCRIQVERIGDTILEETGL